MTFDWDEFQQLSDEEKVDYMRRYRDAARESSRGRPLPPGSIAPEKARHQDGWEVVGRMNPDGTIHYYSDDEKPPSRYDKPGTTERSDDDEDENT